MRRRAALGLAVVALAGCGGSDVDNARDEIRDATEGIRSGGREAVDEAQEALKQLEDSDLPEDARRELEEAKELLEDK